MNGLDAEGISEEANSAEIQLAPIALVHKVDQARTHKPIASERMLQLRAHFCHGGRSNVQSAETVGSSIQQTLNRRRLILHVSDQACHAELGQRHQHCTQEGNARYLGVVLHCQLWAYEDEDTQRHAKGTNNRTVQTECAAGENNKRNSSNAEEWPLKAARWPSQQESINKAAEPTESIMSGHKVVTGRRDATSSAKTMAIKENTSKHGTGM
eukprot:CAMPEP_0117484870 /NCGR_PEP_ID=MMETSP0784-20121206/14678_1 /TAXON_ID=39447 /ORGANISM="" /LENGTH=211 /DNA_ID=CAMNT_0005279451 /DNA_START=1052 /DNA_END=1688 /DNA_ORIENTATION=-